MGIEKYESDQMVLSRITKIREEDEGIRTFFFDRFLPYKAGQFFMMSIPGFKEDEKMVERAFSVSSSPTEGILSFTVRKHGIFTEKLFEMREGDEVELRGPFGHFIYEDDEKNILMIAAGTGIAPIRGILRFIKDKEKANKVKLMYTSRDKHLFYDEIKTMGFDSVFTYTGQEDIKTEESRRGRFSEDEILSNIDKDTKVYICGSRNIVNSFKEKIKEKAYKLYAEGW